MAKENKTGQNGPATETVVETTANAAPVEQTKRKEENLPAGRQGRHEIALLYGQCIIAPVGKEDDEILTTIDDWNSLYNAGDNQGRFVLKSEKKS